MTERGGSVCIDPALCLGLCLSAGGRDTVSYPGYMSRTIRKFITDKFDTRNKRKF